VLVAEDVPLKPITKWKHLMDIWFESDIAENGRINKNAKNQKVWPTDGFVDARNEWFEATEYIRNTTEKYNLILF
jgi:isoleucyl-tRNA synthetase